MEEISSTANKTPETPENKTPETPEEELKTKKKFGKHLSKIPSDILLSPGGIILVLFALVMEASDILIPGGALTIEIIPELIFIILLFIIARVPLTSMILPFLVERIPGLSDIIPSWLVRLFF